MVFGLYMHMLICLYTDPLIYEMAYIEPKNPISQLRISEKKIGRKKKPSLARQNSLFFATAEKL
jgi:hypothetical protein